MIKQRSWSEEEEILLLDLYFILKDEKYTKNHPSIIELSNFLRGIRSTCNNEVSAPKTYRNNTGVFMKLQNIRAIESKGQNGLMNYSYMDLNVWNSYSSNINELRNKAIQIRQKYRDL